MEGQAAMKNDKIIRYSKQLVYLKILLEKNLIDEQEYSRLKSKLMSDYGVKFDIST